jgi:uncharacterized protein (TIGR02145 family)
MRSRLVPLVPWLSLVVAAQALAQGATGDLQVVCEIGVTVSVDGGSARSCTPDQGGVFVEGLSAGRHSVRATRSGYNDLLRDVNIGLGATFKLKLEWTQPGITVEHLPAATEASVRQLGTVSIRVVPAEPPGAVFLNGSRVGDGDLKLGNVPAGQVSVAVERSGRRLSGTFNLPAGGALKVKAHFINGTMEADGQGGGSAGAVRVASTMRDNGDGTVTDPATGLVWEKKPSTGYLNWEQAKAHCQAKGRGWHLPTISELRSLIRGCPATQTGGSCNLADGGCTGWNCRDSSCDGCGYQKGPAGGCYWDSTLEGGCGWFWSSSPVADDSGNAWGVTFGVGDVGSPGVNDARGVRCVR